MGVMFVRVCNDHFIVHKNRIEHEEPVFFAGTKLRSSSNAAVRLSCTNKGMTLVEIIIAIALIGIISVGFLSLYVSSLSMTKTAGIRTKNVANAETIVEQMIAGSLVTSDAVLETVTINGTDVLSNAKIVVPPTAHNIVVEFNGAPAINTTVSLQKVVVEKEEPGLSGNTLGTEIEVYYK